MHLISSTVRYYFNGSTWHLSTKLLESAVHTAGISLLLPFNLQPITIWLPLLTLSNFQKWHLSPGDIIQSQIFNAYQYTVWLRIKSVPLSIIQTDSCPYHRPNTCTPDLYCHLPICTWISNIVSNIYPHNSIIPVQIFIHGLSTYSGSRTLLSLRF